MNVHWVIVQQKRSDAHENTGNRTRRAFSKEDQSNVVDWLVRHHPQKENRRGNIVWKSLTEDKSAHPWNSRHTWQSWREKYLDNTAHYDILISKKYRAIHGEDANPNNAITSAPPASNSFPPKRVTDKSSQSKPSSAKPSVPNPPARHVHLTVPTSPRRPPSPQSNANSPRRAQINRDIRSLARYFDINGIAEHVRARANIFQDLKRSQTTSTWSSSRSALEWRDLYTGNKEEIDNLVREGGLEISPAPVNGNAEPRRRKRRREEEDQSSAVDNVAKSSHRSSQEGVNGAKKRRLNGTERPASHLEPPNVARPPTPSTPGLVPPLTNTLPTGRTPIILVPETPSLHNLSREATPLAQSKLDLTGTNAFVLKTVASALKSAHTSDLGPYGIKGSPIGSLGSGPPSPNAPPHVPSSYAIESPKLSMVNGVPRVNGQVPAMHIFPHSLPSLTPALREKTMSRDIILTPDQGEGNAVELDDNTLDAGIARRKAMPSTNLKGSSIFAQVGQETPRGDVSGNLRQEIFPHTLPHLTPALRPGPHGENEYIINDDTVVFASQHDNEDQEGPVFPKSLPSLTPALRPDPHGETSYIVRDQSIQHLEINKGNSRPLTPQGDQSALDDDEFDGPSPMPYLGSDRHSSRSYSFSHGQGDTLPGPLLEGLAKALSNQFLQEESADAQEVDELANEVDDEEEEQGLNERSGPRYIVPAKRPRRPSESPLFASSSASEDDRARQSKSTTVGVHYPVKAKVKAKGVVRVRGRKNNDRGMKLDEDSESDSQGSMGDSDKENAAMAEDFNEIFQNDSPPAIEEDSPVTKSVAPVTLQDKLDQTPDFHSSPKSLHFSGKTPPSPNVTATSIKPQVPLNLAPPATAPATSKNAAAILRQYGKGLFPSFDVGDKSKETLLKAALSYPSPNIPSELEEALQRKEEPSPLQRLSERVMLGKIAKDDERVDNAGKPRHGKVRFDGVALDRDRRKTTGGIDFGFAFSAGGGVDGGSKGIVSYAVAGPSHSRFKAAPAIFGSQRSSDGRATAAVGSQDIHLERKSVEVMDLADDDEEEDESPLARYSTPSRAAATSPLKTQQGQGHAKSDQTMRSSSQGPSRSTTARFPPPPTPVRVPVIASSSSPLPDSSPPVRSAAGRKGGDVGSVSTWEFGTAMWSPVRFGQASASQAQAGPRHDGAEGADTLLPSSSQQQRPQQSNPSAFRPGFAVEPGQGLSIGFRDQNADAEWVAAARGRPSITSKRIDPRRRSAPIPSDGEIVVYSSRSPSRSRVREGSRRSSMAGGRLRDISGVDALGGISEADKQRILVWLSENRNPDHRSPSSPSFDEEADDESNIFEGLGLMFESMASSNGFALSVPRNVWKQCGDLVETAAVVQAMTDAANAAGLEELEARQRAAMMDAMERRERILSGEVDGRRRSGRYSSGSGVGAERPDLLSGTSGGAEAGAGAGFSANIASSMRERDSSGGDEEMRGRSSRTSRSKSGDGRHPRPRPPSYVPAEVVEPLLSQL